MMDRLTNALKLQAGRLDMRVGQPRFGVVTSIHPDQAMAKVKLQPDGVLTGWLPVLSIWVGDGWGLVCPPSPGDQVLVIPQEGHAEHGIIVGRSYSDQKRPPVAPSGEFWIVHKSGSAVKLTNDGKVRVKGDLYVDGEIFDRHGSLDGFRSVYNQHRHRIHNGSNSDIPVPEV